jgi:hypothetical protein
VAAVVKGMTAEMGRLKSGHVQLIPTRRARVVAIGAFSAVVPPQTCGESRRRRSQLIAKGEQEPKGESSLWWAIDRRNGKWAMGAPFDPARYVPVGDQGCGDPSPQPIWTRLGLGACITRGPQLSTAGPCPAPGSCDLRLACGRPKPTSSSGCHSRSLIGLAH